MTQIARIAVTALAAAAAAAVLAGCSTTDSTEGAPSSSQAAAPTTSTAFPEPPAYTHEMIGKRIVLSTGSADPVDLENTYNHFARTQRRSLPEGGYQIQINCEATSDRLANAHIGVGQLGVAQVGDLGGFDGVVPNAHCP
ncbi:hypothetical protein [Nocardia testacea]|uniref:hypothetical protein n=1 Tax=Nocardia testacea TaxID=248551 RepID=UPI003A8ACAE2